MSIQLVSISHKNAPLSIRELFAFTKEQKEHLMERLIQEGGVEESIVISTCNRTEIYTYAQNPKKKNLFPKIQELILKEANACGVEHVTDYLRFYQDKKAVHHLFQVAAGLDSMVVGEDQILGQVKRAQEEAMVVGCAGTYLNTFFRYAITASKKVKTDTELSKSSVSTATLAIKVAEETLSTLEGKKIMVIGGTGEIGRVVLKNLYSMKGLHIYSTIRNITLSHHASVKSESSTLIDYADRYEHIDEMDVIISATASPHYTLTYGKVKEQLRTEKPRVFVDLAVPMDIDQQMEELPRVFLYNMDDFAELANNNNQMKQEATKEADRILEEYEEDFYRWMIFRQETSLMEEVKRQMKEVAEKKGFDHAVNKLFYHIREEASPEELEIFFRILRKKGE